jgi:thiol:disulfide interchange protein
MAGKITRIIIGIILLIAAIWLFRASMPWTGAIALVFAVLALFGAFAGKKKEIVPEEEKIEKVPEEPKLQ